MPVSTMPILERIARILAGREVSINAEGDDRSAADAVDILWPEHKEVALSILRTLREPDAIMAQKGDPDMWERMVMAALAVEESEAGL